MSNDIKKAKKLYDSKKYDESLELYENLYSQSPESFKRVDLVSYCWAIYQVHVKNGQDEDEISQAAEEITDLIPQSDLNHVNTCPYTFSVFKVMDMVYNEKEYYNLFFWLDKINPKLLDEKRSKFNGRIYRSRKEKYYDYLSKSALECAEWEMCIEVSKEALNSLREFTNNSDAWYNWRIAKSLKQLSHNKDALDYLKEVLSSKNDWFIYKEIAENYHILGEDKKALRCICEAVLTNDPVKVKVNLFYLIYTLLNEENPDIALKHAQMYYLLKEEYGAEIAPDIEELEINPDELDMDELLSQIKEYWMDFKFKNREVEYGTVAKYGGDKNFGFIQTENNGSVFFHKNDFNGDNIYEGQKVSFYTEKSFDKAKNRQSLKAVNIRGEEYIKND